MSSRITLYKKRTVPKRHYCLS